MSALPPLNAVRVFEAVARLGNLTHAAAELNMTQSAVSYQIRQIEAFAGGPLFNRLARGVELNGRGLEVAPVVTRSLADLRLAFRRVRDSQDNLLVISTMQTIAANWLAPRLGQFQLNHPEFAVRLDISPRNVDLVAEGVDIVIRSGNGNWPGLASHFLLPQRFTPVASPHYLAREGGLNAPADMSRHVLIARNDIWWPIWFEAAGLPRDMPVTRSSIEVETQQMAATLAIAGSGIALVTPAFVSEDLRSGRLVQIFDVTAHSGADYHLAYVEGHRARPKIRAFRDWVLKEAAGSRDQ